MIFLVDYENVHMQGLEQLSQLKEADEVIIFSSRNANLNVQSLGEHKCKLWQVFVTTVPGRKKSVDFKLVQYLMMRLMTGAKNFTVVSNDCDFDNIIEFIQDFGLRLNGVTIAYASALTSIDAWYVISHDELRKYKLKHIRYFDATPAENSSNIIIGTEARFALEAILQDSRKLYPCPIPGMTGFSEWVNAVSDCNCIPHEPAKYQTCGNTLDCLLRNIRLTNDERLRCINTLLSGLGTEINGSQGNLILTGNGDGGLKLEFLPRNSADAVEDDGLNVRLAAVSISEAIKNVAENPENYVLLPNGYVLKPEVLSKLVPYMPIDEDCEVVGADIESDELYSSEIVDDSKDYNEIASDSSVNADFTEEVDEDLLSGLPDLEYRGIDEDNNDEEELFPEADEDKVDEDTWFSDKDDEEEFLSDDSHSESEQFDDYDIVIRDEDEHYAFEEDTAATQDMGIDDEDEEFVSADDDPDAVDDDYRTVVVTKDGEVGSAEDEFDDFGCDDSLENIDSDDADDSDEDFEFDEFDEEDSDSDEDDEDDDELFEEEGLATIVPEDKNLVEEEGIEDGDEIFLYEYLQPKPEEGTIPKLTKHGFYSNTFPENVTLDDLESSPWLSVCITEDGELIEPPEIFRNEDYLQCRKLFLPYFEANGFFEENFAETAAQRAFFVEVAILWFYSVGLLAHTATSLIDDTLSYTSNHNKLFLQRFDSEDEYYSYLIEFFKRIMPATWDYLLPETLSTGSAYLYVCIVLGCKLC